MNKKFDYEEKIYGDEEGARIKLFNPWAYDYLPSELKGNSGRLLDIGCGAGTYINSVKKENPLLELYGVDVSRRAIKMARVYYPEIDFKVANINHLPYPTNYFDAVVLRHVLEHLGDPKQDLSEVRRVLRPKGLLYSSTPIEGDPLILSAPLKYAEKYHGHKRRFSRESLKSLMRDSGFNIKRFYYSGFLIYQILEVIYYPILNFLKLPASFSVNSYASTYKGTFIGFTSFVLRKLVIFLFNLETIIIPNKIPGLFMHIIAFKSKVKNRMVVDK